LPEEEPVRLADVFGGRSQLIVYHHMWFAGEQWQCLGCTGFTSQYSRLKFLDNYDARFVIVTKRRLTNGYRTGPVPKQGPRAK
jgi:predicted dithiol-disulfide oxidoreductase (DUF899 family)